MTETNPTPSAEEPTGEQALRWLIELCEGTGKGTLWNVDARAVLRAIRQAEQAARADERRKTLEEVLQAVVALRRTRYHYGDWSVYKREACDEVLKVLRAFTNDSGEPGEAA